MGSDREPKTRPGPRPPASLSILVAMQCFAAVAATLIGYKLGETLAAKLAAGLLGALIAAFLTAPGREYPRRVVAVGLFVALLSAVRKAPRKAPTEVTLNLAGGAPNVVTVAMTGVVGFALGTGAVSARGGLDDRMPDRPAGQRSGAAPRDPLPGNGLIQSPVLRGDWRAANGELLRVTEPTPGTYVGTLVRGVHRCFHAGDEVLHATAAGHFQFRAKWRVVWYSPEAAGLPFEPKSASGLPCTGYSFEAAGAGYGLSAGGLGLCVYRPDAVCSLVGAHMLFPENVPRP